MPLANPGVLDLDEVLGFGYAEHLLVWSWRLMVTGRGGCPLIEREFAEACGEEGREVLATFATFLQFLAYASRRRLVVGHPGAIALTVDERQVLTLIAAAQSDEPDLLDAHLCWLAKADVRHTLAIGARALATALSIHGLCLALPAARTFPLCGLRRPERVWERQ